MTTSLADLSVVILSYNRKECLERHLRSLLNGSIAFGYEVIVVDNNSTDGTVELLCSLRVDFSQLRLVLNSSNTGVAPGRNSGLRIAKGNFVVCLDDDAEIAVEDLCRVPSVFERMPAAGILAFRVWDGVRKQYLNDFGGETTPVANFAGAAHAFRRSVFGRIGYLDELCTFGGEELDMSIRAMSAGFITVLVPEITVIHHSLVRSNSERSDRREKWLYNFVRIFFKHFPFGMASTLTIRFFSSHLWNAPHSSRRLLVAVKRGIVDGRLGHQQVSAQAVAFYSSKTLNPDFGNMPILRKLARRGSQWIRNSRAVRERRSFDDHGVPREHASGGPHTRQC